MQEGVGLVKPGTSLLTEKPTDAYTIIPVVEELLVVSREVVETGKVLIQKRVAEEEATVNLPIVQESYIVDRKPGSENLLMQAPSIRYEGDDMIIPVVREVLVTEKRYIVTEELHVRKTTTEIPYMQQVTLRKETIEVKRTSMNQ